MTDNYRLNNGVTKEKHKFSLGYVSNPSSKEIYNSESKFGAGMGSVNSSHRPNSAQCLVLCGLQAENTVYILNFGEKKSKDYLEMWKLHRIQISLFIKFYWNIFMFSVIYDCFYTATVELSSSDSKHLQSLKYLQK